MARAVWLVLKKALSLVLTIFIIASLIFWMFHIGSGDPQQVFIPRGSSYELIQELREENHLDEPLLVQYVYYIFDAFAFDLRISAGVHKGHDINDFIWEHVASTVLLFLATFLLSIFAGWAVEKYVYSRKRTRTAFGTHLLSIVLASAPIFCVGLLAYAMLSVCAYLPIHGDGIDWGDLSLSTVPEALRHLVLPVLVGVLPSTGFLILLQRAGRLEAAHDASWGMVRHGRWKPGSRMLEYLSLLRPYLRYYVAWTMGCVLVSDMLLNYEGLGYAVWDGAVSRDYPFLMAALYVISILTLAIMACTSIALALLRRRPIATLLSDWISHDSSLQGPSIASPVARGELPLRRHAIALMRGLIASRIGLAAAAVLIILAAVGVFAPLLATVDDPLAFDSREPNVLSDDYWWNPLPPSLERSPYTGFLHPLGTDAQGIDVYSMWLYAARHNVASLLVAVAVTLVLSWLVGMVAVRTVLVSGDSASRLIDFMLSATARASIAISFTAFGACLMALPDNGRLLLSIYLPVMVIAWAQVFIMRRVRLRARLVAQSSGKITTSVRTLMPCILESSFFVGKFAVLIVMAAMSGIWFIYNVVSWFSWEDMLALAFRSDAFIRGDWHVLVPPVLGLILLASSAFLVLDRLEVVAKHIDRPPCIELEPTEDISVQASSGRQMKSGEPM